MERVDVGGVLATGRPLAVAGAVEIPAFGSHAFEPAKVALDIQRIDRSIAIGGTIETIVSGNCDRCLEDVRRTISVQVDETLAANGGTEGPFGDASLLDGTTLDLADLCRQLVDSALPLVLLCSDDCPGLCPMCGKPRREGACACTDLA